MKKILLLLCILTLSYSAFSQVKISLRVAPGLALNRVTDLKSNDGYFFSKYKNSFAITLGPSFDFMLSDNIAFSTGLWFSAGGASYYSDSLKTTYLKVSTQTVMLPVGFKVFTNEVATDMKIYFSCLGLANVKVSEKYKSSFPTIPSGSYKQTTSRFGAGLQLSAGLDWKLGESTALFGGLFVYHDLTNRISSSYELAPTTNKLYKAMSYKQTTIGLEVGVKF